MYILHVRKYIYRHAHTKQAQIAGEHGSRAGRRQVQVASGRGSWAKAAGGGRGPQAMVVGKGHKPHYTRSARRSSLARASGTLPPGKTGAQPKLQLNVFFFKE